MSSTTSSLGLSITNPLILYRALLATQRIRPDPAQHRLALELQQLYFRLKDYSPEIEYRWRLEKAARISRATKKDETEKRQAILDQDGRGFSLSRIFGGSGAASSMLAMTRTVPVYDSAMGIDSPQGMLLYGEVGRGKSMLLDMLYSSLPNEKKRRWHFNTFILDIFRRLELARIERSSTVGGPALEQEHVVLSLARDTMEVSPILFMDEFQMPDRVSAKLVHSFFTSFFSLGGVLIASSNRIPDELAKASGIEFSSMGSARWGRGGRIWEMLSPGQQQARSDFGKFVDLLKRRCEVWEMEGERDWRREDEEPNSPSAEVNKQIDASGGIVTSTGNSSSSGQIMPVLDENEIDTSADHPRFYFVSGADVSEPGETSTSMLEAELKRLNPTNEWGPQSLTVYARQIKLPVTSTESGVAVLPFNLLCASYLGAADYISIASTFHTLVVREVPILTLLLKNEARRFITFLDACYEARCRLIVEAAAPPDRLFFPETRARRGIGNMLEEGDSIDSEAFSEMYQDSTAPFRPNVSLYQEGDTAQPTMSLYNKTLRSVLADEDADFGPTYGNGRSHGMSVSEDFSDERAEQNAPPTGMADHELRQGPDFTQGAGVFTGQDEQFAYKRARSRLWEMCGRKWWRDRKGRPEEWWTPEQQAGRFWEKKKDALLEKALARAATDVEMGGSVLVDGGHDGNRAKLDIDQDASSDKDSTLFKHGASPFRTSAEPPPKFGWQHAWGLGLWGKRAGEWGKGVEGDRHKDRSKDTSSQ